MKWLKKRRARKQAKVHIGEAFRYMKLRFKGENAISSNIQYSIVDCCAAKSLTKASEKKTDEPRRWCAIGAGGTVVYSDEPYQDYYTWVSTKKQTETFSDAVLRIMQEKRMTSGVFYRKAGLDRKLFSKLKTDRAYQPNKKTAIRCCLALELDPDAAVDLLKCAGYALSDTSEFDLVIRYCIEHGVYDTMTVSEMLYSLRVWEA